MELKAKGEVRVRASEQRCGGCGLVLPASVAERKGVRAISFWKEAVGEGGEVRVTAVNKETGERREAMMSCVILPDVEVDCVILGTEAQSVLRVIPDTVTGKPIFK